MNLSFPLSVRVQRKTALTPEICAIELAALDGSALLVWQAGAHIQLQLPVDGGTAELMRCYSLCGGLQSDDWTIAVKREPRSRGASHWIHERLQVGQILQVLAVDNFFALDATPAPKLLIAGGIGITPMLSMLETLLAQDKMDFQLIYLTRDTENTPAFALLEDPRVNERMLMHHDAGDAAQSYDLWPHLETPSAAHVYCCGPAPLMDAVRDMSGHWPSQQIHFESFGYRAAAGQVDQAFDVLLRPSGKRLRVDAQQSLLDALRAEGVHIASSCESGSCGSCKTAYVAGEVEHRDFVLRDDERMNFLMPCVSRGVGASCLELELH